MTTDPNLHYDDGHTCSCGLTAPCPTIQAFWAEQGGHDITHKPCGNCDDRHCMACVFREVHDRCEHDCPMCGPRVRPATNQPRQTFSPVDGAPIPYDPPMVTARVEHKPEPGYVDAQDVIDRLVIDLARATGTPESLVRLGAGIPPARTAPRYPAIPVPDPEATP